MSDPTATAFDGIHDRFILSNFEVLGEARGAVNVVVNWTAELER